MATRKAAPAVRTGVSFPAASAAVEPEPEAGGPARTFPYKGKDASRGCFSVTFSPTTTPDKGMVIAGYGNGDVYTFDLASGAAKVLGSAHERSRAPVMTIVYRPKNFSVGSPQAEALLKETFDAIDIDGGGTLDKEEMRASAWIIKGDIAEDMSEEELHAAIEAMDADGDGEVDFAEFASWWRRTIQVTEPDSDAARNLLAHNNLLRGRKLALGGVRATLNGLARLPKPKTKGAQEDAARQLKVAQAAVDAAAAVLAGDEAKTEPLHAAFEGVLTVAGCNGVVQHYDMQTRELLHTFQERDKNGNNSVNSLCFSEDGAIFATGGQDHKVRLYDEETKRLYQVFERDSVGDSPGHSNRVYGIRFHPTKPTQMLSGGWSDTVQLWDIRRKTRVKHLSGPHVCGDALDVHGDVLLTGSGRSTRQLELWDMKTFKALREIDWDGPPGTPPTPDEPCQVSAAKFSPDGRLVAAGGSVVDKPGARPSATLKVFDTETGAVKLSASIGQVGGVAFSKDGALLAAGGGDGTVYVYDLRSMV